MKIPKIIEIELAKRGYHMCEEERWRKVRGMDWCCAYFQYKSKVCLITVARSPFEYLIEVLYSFPILSKYVVKGNKFNIRFVK